MSAAESHSTGDLRHAFGLGDREFAALLWIPEEQVEREVLLAELSTILVGQMTPEEIEDYLTHFQPNGIAADGRFPSERIPLAVAEEPGGLKRVVADARRNVGRKIGAATRSSGVPQDK